MAMPYPKRLIEVDLPIKRVSEHARREKDMRRGHVPLLYIWPATRPPAACRAVICAALWPDPADPSCPESFRKVAREWMLKWTRDYLRLLGSESLKRFLGFQKNPRKLNDNEELRNALLDFIADFANWDNSTTDEYLETSRALTQVAHEALGGAPGTKPLVMDSFAGGGAIPLEALRAGAEAYASDLNPVAVLLNKVTVEYIPRFGPRLADELQKWLGWAQERAREELTDFYPVDIDGNTPIAYLWARTVICEGPTCGVEIPLIRNLWLARKGNLVAVKLVPDKAKKRVDFEILHDPKGKDVGQGTVRRSSATCPVCGYTTQAARVRAQLRQRNGGANDARLFCVVTVKPNQDGRKYRLPTKRDLDAVDSARRELERRMAAHKGPISLIPDEDLPIMSGVFNAPIYGHTNWGSLFTSRQALAISVYARLASEYRRSVTFESADFSKALNCVLALAVNRLADLNASLCVWQLSTPNTAHVFGRWALPMIMDFGEVNPIAAAGGSPESVVRRMVAGINYLANSKLNSGTVELVSATNHSLPDDSVHAFVTDPPYYNAVPYADLSDFFYVWLRRTVGDQFPDLFSASLSPKDDEICEMAGWDPKRYPHKDKKFFERKMEEAMAEGRRVLVSNGIAVIVFAHKSTSGWEAQLQAMINAGWIITGSWPIDTEMVSRLRAKNSAALASSIHLVCRPRENPDGSLRTDVVGDWRDVLAELPRRIHDWMPRLAKEGVVGADAIFACLGPALEIFSRYSRVETAGGQVVPLGDQKDTEGNIQQRGYLSYVWEAVAKEALNMIFEGADATGFEEDARLTAMWLWTLSAGANGNGTAVATDDEEDEDESSVKPAKTSGYILEYDAARKIAQGLGAHLDKLSNLVEVKGETARLLPVSERARYLFGKGDVTAAPKRKPKVVQLALGDILGEVEKEEGIRIDKDVPKPGNTVLDRVHQSMILFGAGRGEALRRFLVTDGAGQDQRFWRLAQALLALYPSGNDERRWVEGVMAKKKSFGF